MSHPDLYDRIGVGYDATRRADPYLAHRLAVLLGLRPEGVYLDLACGTGNYTEALAARGGLWLGVDVSQAMLGAARAKRGRASYEAADATRLPYHDDRFDGAICTLAIHHFPDLAAAFEETARVVRGRFVVLSAWPEQIERYWLTEYFPEAIRRSAAQMPGRDAVGAAFARAGFELIAEEPYEVRDDLEDLFCYAGKRRPELYLSPEVRAGISNFANLADPAEVDRGVERLAADLDSGRIRDVMAAHESEAGDYVFLVARRRR